MIDLAFSLPASPDLRRELTEVLRLRVDDTEILQGHGEERREVLLEELLCLGEALAGGAPQATALFGSEPVELSVVTSEEDAVQITVLLHGMPPRLLLHRHPSPLPHLLKQIAALATEGRAAGLSEPVTRCLDERAANLRRPLRPPTHRASQDPVILPVPGPRHFEAPLGGGWSFCLDRDPGAELPRLAPSETGWIRLRPPGDTETALALHGPLLPFLEALLPLLEDALAEVEAGALGPIAFGEATLLAAGDRCRLMPSDATIPCAAQALFEATLRTFGDYLRAVAEGARSRAEPLPARIREADESRQALLARLQLRFARTHPRLALGDDRLAARPARAGPGFGPGRLRHVGWRRIFAREIEGRTFASLIAHHRTLAVGGEHGLTLLAARTGELRAHLEAFDRASPVPGSADLLAMAPARIARISPDGTPRWTHVPGPCPDSDPLITRRSVTFLTHRHSLTSLDLGSGAPRFSVLSATDPLRARWLLRSGPGTLLVDAAGVAERFDADGEASRLGLQLLLHAPPLPLGRGRILFLGEADGVLVARMHRGDRAVSTSLLLPLLGIFGAHRSGRRVFLWGPSAGPRRASRRELATLVSWHAGQEKLRIVHPGLPAPLLLAEVRGGTLLLDGEGRCFGLPPAAAPQTLGPSIDLHLGSGAPALLPFGEIAVACAERLCVISPADLRLLAEIDLNPAEGPVLAIRGPGASISMIDTHGCLQRFEVGGHLSVI